MDELLCSPNFFEQKVFNFEDVKAKFEFDVEYNNKIAVSIEVFDEADKVSVSVGGREVFVKEFDFARAPMVISLHRGLRLLYITQPTVGKTYIVDPAQSLSKELSRADIVLKNENTVTLGSSGVWVYDEYLNEVWGERVQYPNWDKTLSSIMLFLKDSFRKDLVVSKLEDSIKTKFYQDPDKLISKLVNTLPLATLKDLAE